MLLCPLETEKLQVQLLLAAYSAASLLLQGPLLLWTSYIMCGAHMQDENTSPVCKQQVESLLFLPCLICYLMSHSLQCKDTLQASADPHRCSPELTPQYMSVCLTPASQA